MIANVSNKAIFVCMAISLGWCTSAAGDQYAVAMTKMSSSPQAPTHLSTWKASVAQGNIIMSWSCAPFRHTQASNLYYNAEIRLVGTKSGGAVSVQPARCLDRTNISKSDRSATITANVSGLGVAEFDVTVDLADDFPAAGNYETTVELNITAL